MQVFISWSGDRSRLISLKLHEVLPTIVNVKPWHSERDLGADEQWRARLEEAIEQSEFCVVCLTRENLQKQWPVYEAGRLVRKGMCAILFDLTPEELQEGPFAQIDHVPCTEEGLLTLARRLNERSRTPLNERIVRNAVHGVWDELAREFEPLYAAAVSPTDADFNEWKRLATSGRGRHAPPATEIPYARRRDALLVVDIQNDFFPNGSLEVPDVISLLKPLNAAIKSAVDSDMIVVFAQDWHPRNHKSFGFYGGQWAPHCVQHTNGAAFHPQLIQPPHVEVVQFGMEAHMDGYSPYENPRMDAIINRVNVETVYVTGIALEYCVYQTCRETLKRRKRVVAIDSLIRAVYPERSETVWGNLRSRGVERISHPPFAVVKGAGYPPPDLDEHKWPEFHES